MTFPPRCLTPEYFHSVWSQDDRRDCRICNNLHKSCRLLTWWMRGWTSLWLDRSLEMHDVCLWNIIVIFDYYGRLLSFMSNRLESKQNKSCWSMGGCEITVGQGSISHTAEESDCLSKVLLRGTWICFGPELHSSTPSWSVQDLLNWNTNATLAQIPGWQNEFTQTLSSGNPSEYHSRPNNAAVSACSSVLALLDVLGSLCEARVQQMCCMKF